MSNKDILEMTILEERLKEMEIKEMEYWYELSGPLVSKIK